LLSVKLSLGGYGKLAPLSWLPIHRHDVLKSHSGGNSVEELLGQPFCTARHPGCIKITLALWIVLCSGQIAAGQQAAPPPSDSEQAEIRTLLQRIDQLESRVKELEAKQGVVAEPAPPSPAKQIQDTMENPPPAANPGIGNMQIGNGPSLKIRGFSDVLWSDSDQHDTTNSFALGQMDLFITSALSRRMDMLSEVVFEADSHNAYGVDVERLLFRYSFNDYFKMSAGRYHTAIGFYNTAYHHSTWMQTAVDRPFIFEFEDSGGILPIHNVGLSAEGLIPSGKFGLHYVAEIGNGRTSRSPLAEPVQNKIDENNGKAFNLAVFARPETMRGLQFGFSYYHDNLTPDGLPNIRESIMAAHIVYQNSQFEFLNEAILIRHALVNTPLIFRTPAFYTQISHSIGLFRPYFRYQFLNASGQEPIFGDVGRQNGPSVGLKYDFGEYANFKAQYDRSGTRLANSVNGVTTQLSFTF
jgi:hypothetical protein